MTDGPNQARSTKPRAAALITLAVLLLTCGLEFFGSSAGFA